MEKGQWQSSEAQKTLVIPQEDSPPAYHTMYPETPLPPPPPGKETHITGEKWPPSEDQQKVIEEKQEKMDQKSPIVKISKETKERLLEKAHGAREALRYSVLRVT